MNSYEMTMWLSQKDPSHVLAALVAAIAIGTVAIVLAAGASYLRVPTK